MIKPVKQTKQNHNKSPSLPPLSRHRDPGGSEEEWTGRHSRRGEKSLLGRAPLSLALRTKCQSLNQERVRGEKERGGVGRMDRQTDGRMMAPGGGGGGGAGDESGQIAVGFDQLEFGCKRKMG